LGFETSATQKSPSSVDFGVPFGILFGNEFVAFDNVDLAIDSAEGLAATDRTTTLRAFLAGFISFYNLALCTRESVQIVA